MAAEHVAAAQSDAGKRIRVSRPTDREESEARGNAQRLSGPAPGGESLGCTACAAARPCSACAAGAGQVGRAAALGSTGAHPFAAAALRGAGEPLPEGPRAYFEQRLGADLGVVRLHRGQAATGAARALGARAFTLGNRIGLGDDQAVAAGPAGWSLLAHELTHVLQPDADRVLRRDNSGGGAPDPADAGVAGPVAGVGRPAPQPDATPIPAAGAMTDEQRLARIQEILTNRWVGPVDEWELEALWGAFDRRLREVAGAHLDLWNQSWQRGADLANLPAAREFLSEFEACARDKVRSVLTDSETRINAERIRYGIQEIRTETLVRRMVPTGDQGPGGMPIRAEEDVPEIRRSYAMQESPESAGLQTAAAELVAKRADVDQRVGALRIRQQGFERTVRRPTGDRVGGVSVMADETEITDPAAHAALEADIRAAEAEYDGLRVQMEARHPILAAYSGREGLAGLRQIATPGASPGKAQALYAVIADRLANVERVRAELGPGGRLVVWKLPEILAMTKLSMGIEENSLRAFMVAAKVDQVETDAQLQQAALGAIALGLGLLAAVPTGGSSLVAAGTAVAAVGGAAISVHIAAEGVQNYLLESAATGTDFDRARAISQDDPSLFWLALDIVGALVDAGAAVAAVRTAIRTAATAYRELAPLVRAAARTRASADEAMEALKTAARRQSLPTAVLDHMVARTRRLREGADEVAAAALRVEHAQLEAGRAIAREGQFLAELPGTAGHGWKITASGQVTRCSTPCLFLRGLFAEQLARHPELEGQLAHLEAQARAAAAAGDAAKGREVLGEVRNLEGRLRDLAPPVVPRAEAGMGGRMRAVGDADDLEFLRMHRPDPQRPPASVLDPAVSAEQRQLRQTDWENYCRYHQERVQEIEHQLGTGTVSAESPLDWDSYRRFLGSESDIQRGRGFQKGVTGSMTDPGMSASYLTEGDIALSRKAKPTNAPGELVRPDQFMVDQQQLRLMQDGGLASQALDVTAASNKSRRFDRVLRDGTQAELRAVERQIADDVEELFSKYAGALHVRREGPLLGRSVRVRELILVYELEHVPAAYREAVRSIAGRLGSARASQGGFTFWITFQ